MEMGWGGWEGEGMNTQTHTPQMHLDWYNI